MDEKRVNQDLARRAPLFDSILSVPMLSKYDCPVLGEKQMSCRMFILIFLLFAALVSPAISFGQDTQTVAVNPQETHKQVEALACDPVTVNYKVRTVRDFVPLPPQPA